MRIKSCSHPEGHHDGRMRAPGLFILLLVVAALLMAARDARATNWTEAEIRAMPPYCAARYSREPAQYKHWQQILGPDFLHTHHLCDGFGYLNRYTRARTPQQQKSILESAMGTLNYMVNHASPSYSLMPEVYLNRGQVFAYRNQVGEALKDYHKVIELNPNMVRGYVLAAGLYDKVKQRDKALELATEGLRRNPDSTSLRRLYDRLGGKQPYPVAEPAAAPPQAPTEGAAETAAKPETPPAPANATPTASDAAPATADAAPATSESSPAPAIGTPSNPWCRFCPEPAK